jgi:hypothetical protein
VNWNRHSHPIGILSRLAAIGGTPISFEFSRYHYEPRAIEDERKSFRVGLDEMDSWIESTTASLSLSNQEDLAFHSRVYLKNERIRHIPMVDFVGKLTAADLKRVDEAMRSFSIPEYEIYDSGRSLHLYGLALISHEEWLRFLGRTLLLNLPDEKEIVDGRWVGHRLMAGYGTLRWTKNHHRYQNLPTRIQEISP